MLEQKIFHYIIRVPKDQAAFFYFQLEANEGLSFYSTLEDSLNQGHRDIDLKGDVALKPEFDQLINKLKTSFPLQILKEETLVDK